MLDKKDKRKRQLLKTVVKESIPFVLRPYAYMIFSGGFLYLKDSIEKQNCPLNYEAI